LANYDPELAAKVQIIPGLDARLAKIDVAAGTDSYHMLQGLRDPQAESETSKCCYLYQRSGSTGSRGNIDVEGPMEQPKVAQLLAEIFKEKTGLDWGSMKPGDRAKPDMFWLQQQATPDLAARWQYYVSDGVDGKRTGWYPYEPNASDEVEELYSQHVANARESRTATRVVNSGYFTYLVDLDQMKQTNQRTKKVRNIRRAVGDDADEDGIRAGGPLPKKARAARAKATGAAAPRAAQPKMKVSASRALKAKPAKRSLKAVAKPTKPKKKIGKVGTKKQVLAGKKAKTKSGLKADDLMKNGETGRVVTKRMYANGKKTFDRNLAKWVAATSRARTELGLVGFVAMKKGSALYSKTREFYIA